MFRNIAAVQILHEPEEGQFVEEDLGDLHQKVFSTVLQSSALKLTECVLERRRCSDCVCLAFRGSKLKGLGVWFIPVEYLQAVCGKTGQILCFHHAAG